MNHPNIYKAAMDVQDACNLRAIARLLVEAADKANGQYDDPAVILITSKIESLVHAEEGLRFSKAWDVCMEKAGLTDDGTHDIGSRSRTPEVQAASKR